MSWMNLMRDMVWAVLLAEPLPKLGLTPDRITVDCSPAGIWLHDTRGRTLGAVWGVGWWAPTTPQNVECIATRLEEQLHQTVAEIAA